MRARLAEQLAAAEMKMLRGLGHLAADLGVRLFLVGGCVRDIILGRPREDWDLAIEGDGLAYARALAEAWHAKPVIHDRFLTATMRLRDGTHFDVTTARREAYPASGALPVVQPASIERDLWRRDFSINAIAIELTPDQWGRILDPTGGRQDIEAELVRALHERSFEDDATRIVRAIGFEQRLGFTIEPQTEDWIRGAASGGALHTVSSERLGEVILPLLRDTVGPRALKRANELGVARAMGARAAFTPTALAALEQVPEGLKRFRAGHDPQARALACMAALLVGRGVAADRMVERLHLDRLTARELRSAQRFLGAWPGGFAPGQRDGDLWEQLRETTFAAAFALWLANDDAQVREVVQRYWHELRHTRPDFDAARLADMGFGPSPHFGDALRVAVLSKLNRGAGPDEQLTAAARVLRHARDYRE